MTTRGSVAKSVRQQKEAHPELFCPDRRCLWRTGDGSRCPRHGGAPEPKIRCLALVENHHGDTDTCHLARGHAGECDPINYAATELQPHQPKGE